MSHRDHIQDWFTFLRFPSISALPEHQGDIQACATWLQHYMEQIGLSIEVWDEQGYPVLLGSTLPVPSGEVILFYGHYDVQPVDPLDSWISPPFEPSIRQECVYARGASDDKGQIFYTLAAIGEFLSHHPVLPYQIKILIEGQEESGSSYLHHLLPRIQNSVQANHVVVVDSGWDSPDRPVVTLGARGIMTLHFRISEASTDLHSGQCGGIVYNPNRALVEMLAALHDRDHRVTLPGFYDGIIELTTEEQEHLFLHFDPVYFRDCYGCSPSGMERGFDPVIANWLRPTLEINGISGGYQGPGFKTVIPAYAEAHLSCRLVPGQDPDRIMPEWIQWLQEHTPSGMSMSILSQSKGSAAFRSSASSRIATCAAKSYTDVCGTPCRYILGGGSIPIVPALCAASGGEVVLIGTARPSDRIHAPNEHFHLQAFDVGYRAILCLLEQFLL